MYLVVTKGDTMKKLIIAMFVLMFAGICYSEITNDIDVHVRVNSKFELTVDRTFIDFETMEPGEIKQGVPDSGIRISAKSNSGSPWFLTINNVRELSNGADIIPNENFFWYGWKGKGSTGTFYGEKSQVFTVTPTLMYSPSSQEFNNLRLVGDNKIEGTDVFVKFGLKVPFKQNSGEYHTLVRFTMTE